MEKSIDELIEPWQNAKGTPMHDILLVVEKRGFERELTIAKLFSQGLTLAEISAQVNVPLPRLKQLFSEALAQE